MKSYDVRSKDGLSSLRLFEQALAWLKAEDRMEPDASGISRYRMGGLESLLATHGVTFDPKSSDARALAAKQQLPEVADPAAVWFRCVHDSELFLLWHRAYVRAMERSIRSVLADHEIPGWERFRIPYWDWIHQGALPEAFWNNPRSSLYDSERVAAANRGDIVWMRGDGSPSRSEVNPFESADAVAAQDAFRTFSNDFLSGWHNGIHAALGHDMSASATAARDPVFWVHHANVDRLLVAWLSEPGAPGRAHVIPSDVAVQWDAAGFRFPVRTSGGGYEWYQPRFADLGLQQSAEMGRAEYEDVSLPEPVPNPSRRIPSDPLTRT